MSDLLQSCIVELQKEPSLRNNDLIITYLKTLPSFIQMLKQDIEKFPDLLTKVAQLLTFTSCPKDSLIIKNGEKGNDFYIVLSGLIQVFSPKPTTYALTEEEYLFHLFKLRDNRELELLKECIRLNNCVYPIGEDNFDTLVKNIVHQKGRGQMYQDYPRIINRAKETLAKLNHSDKDKENLIGKLTVEQYIDMNKVELYVNNYSDDAKQRKNVVIPQYEIVNKIETGQIFGDVALENPNSKRTATLISIDHCYFGVLNKSEYIMYIKGVNDKNKKKFFNVIYSYNVFQLLSKYTFEKKYYNFFKFRKCERGEMLLKENEKCENVFFLLNGKFEISTCRNIIDVNKLLIQYKQRLSKLCHSNGINESNVYTNYNNEVKQNEDLIINHKFKTKKQNEMIFTKQIIRLGTANNREIIGLYDYINIGDNNEHKGLINCKCLSNNCEMYFIPIDIYYKVYDVEESVKELTNGICIKKLKVMIDKLNEYKERMFMLMNKHEEEKAMFHYNLSLLNQNKFNKRNRLYELENNSVFAFNNNDNNSSNNIHTYIKNSNSNNNIQHRSGHGSANKRIRIKKDNLSVNISKININNIVSMRRNESERINNKKKRIIYNVKDYYSLSNKSNEKYLQKIKRDILHKNLYENVLDSYIKPMPLVSLPRIVDIRNRYRSINTDNCNDEIKYLYRKKKAVEVSPEFDECKTESNKMNLVDCLIMDRFNSCYNIALNNINNHNKNNN